MTKVTDRFNIIFFLLIFTGVLWLNVILFEGMFHALAFATIIGATFYSPFQKILQRMPEKRSLAALLTCALIIIIIGIPAAYILTQLGGELIQLYKDPSLGGKIKTFLAWFDQGGPLEELINQANSALNTQFSIDQLADEAFSKAKSSFGKGVRFFNSLVGDTLNFAFQFLIMMMVIFAIFLEGDHLKRFFFNLSPLPQDQEELILKKFAQMNFVSIICNGVGGVLQGTLGGLALWICDFNSIFLWTTVMIILAFIPLVGISIIYIPATIYLLVEKNYGQASFLFIFCSISALAIENWFKPRFIGKRIKVDGLLMLFYIIAGMSVFGMAGIFYGPIICIIFLTLVEIFEKSYLPLLTGKGTLKKSKEDSY